MNQEDIVQTQLDDSKLGNTEANFDSLPNEDNEDLLRFILSSMVLTGDVFDEPETKRSPFQCFRKGSYLVVTDLANQLWCEQQLEYSYRFPGIKAKKSVKAPTVQKESLFHVATDLDVHDMVAVETITKEDNWAVELINLYEQMLLLDSETKVRGFSVFGELLSSNIAVKGVIDEIRPSGNGGLALVKIYTKPEGHFVISDAKKRCDSFQLMLHKHLLERFDHFVLGREFIEKHFHPRFDMPLSESIKEFAREHCLPCETLGEVVDAVTSLRELISIPPIDMLVIEYISPDSSLVLMDHIVPFDEGWFLETLKDMFSFWRGERKAKGVDIEDAWKCYHCPFINKCLWRLAKQIEFEERNKKNFVSLNSMD